MFFKTFVWTFFIATSVFTLVSAAIHYTSYNLFIPHSDIAYTGMMLFWHKAILVSSLASFGLFFIHGLLAGQALWQRHYSRAAQVSLGTFIILGFLLIVHLIRS